MAGRRHRRGRRKKGNWFTRLTVGKKIAVCAGSLALCFIAGGVIFVAAKLGKIDTEEIDTSDIEVSKEAEETGEGYTNVALFGIDSRSGELEHGTRTDCLIVASLNNKTKEVRMSSVYRDTLLDIKDGHLQKCNAAYSFGGPTQAINMLNKNLDLDIEKFVTVDFKSISETIDLLGGVDINVKQEEIKYLNKFVGETARVAKKKAKKVTRPGKQHLNGVQATTYARIRSTAGGDFTRTERQRLVIQKIVEKAQKSDIATINKIIDKLLPTIKTNFSAAEILSYAKDFAKYEIGASSGFPFEKTTDTISGLGSIVIPVKLDNNVQELHEFLYDDKDYKISKTVQTISDAVVARVGQRQAESSSTLNTKTYKTAPEDRAQESNRYAPTKSYKTPSSSQNNQTTTNPTNQNNNTNNSTKPDANKPGNTGGSGNGGSTGGNTGGNTNSGNKPGNTGGAGNGGSTGGNTGGNTNGGSKPGNTGGSGNGGSTGGSTSGGSGSESGGGSNSGGSTGGSGSESGGGNEETAE